MTLSTLWNSGSAAALFNHLWQSTVMVLMAWLVTFALRPNPARVRYWVWMFASVKFLVPFALLASLGTWSAKPIPGPQIGSAVYTVLDEISQPLQQMQAPAVVASQSPYQTHPLELILPILAIVWLCGVVSVLAVWMVRRRRVVRIAADAQVIYEGREVIALRRAERNAGIRNPISVLVSPRATEPGIFGVIRPVLLWPQGISDRLTDAQIKAIAAHEVEHVRRRDNLTAAIHAVVEALFWFHPAVRWMSSKLMEERERACDEKVLEQSAQPEVYAESILKVCAFCLEPSAPCVAGVSGSDLKERVLRIMTHRGGMSLSFGRRVVLCSAASLTIGLPLGFGILHAMQAPAQLVHATSGPAPAFDVVSIKPNHDSTPRHLIGLSPTGFTAKRASLRDLIGMAYGVRGDDQITGGPGWMNSEYYDVEAKESEADIEAAKKLSMDQQRTQLSLMLQSMLADRFGLKTAIETRDLTVYALVTAKGGVKMKEVQVDPFPPPGTTPPPGAHLPRLMSTDSRQWTASAFPMGEFTNFLSHFEELDNRVVVDETGLKGNYDFVLSGVSMRPQPADGNHEAGAEPVTPIFSALQEQLGLKLEPRKAPVEVLAIEHAERPSAN
jgi:bla regulator protein blaR1